MTNTELLERLRARSHSAIIRTDTVTWYEVRAGEQTLRISSTVVAQVGLIILKSWYGDGNVRELFRLAEIDAAALSRSKDEIDKATIVACSLHRAAECLVENMAPVQTKPPSDPYVAKWVTALNAKIADIYTRPKSS